MRNFLSVFVFLGLINSVHAFTITTSNFLKFAKPEITINVANVDCANAGMTASQLLDRAMEAADLYWNTVATSALELKRGSLVAANLLTDVSLIASKGETGTILIGCNNAHASFAGASTTVGLGQISDSGGVRGIVLINDQNTSVATTNSLTVLALIAHEMGHAIGLGHSEDPIALMYFSLGGKTQERLTQDDWDGATYLYPHDSAPGSCGTIGFTDGNGGPGGKQLPFSLMLLVLLGLAAIKTVRVKAFSPFVN
jgi:hypothetical protein